MWETLKVATFAIPQSHSVDCKAERVRPGRCGNDTPIVPSASWRRSKTVTRNGRRTSPRRRGTSRLTAGTSGVRCLASENPRWYLQTLPVRCEAAHPGTMTCSNRLPLMVVDALRTGLHAAAPMRPANSHVKSPVRTVQSRVSVTTLVNGYFYPNPQSHADFLRGSWSSPQTLSRRSFPMARGHFEVQETLRSRSPNHPQGSWRDQSPQGHRGQTDLEFFVE